MQKTTDVSLEHVKEAITLGTNMINTDTDLGLALTGTLRKVLAKDRTIRDLRKPLGSARDLIKEVVKDKIALFGSMGMIRERR